MATTDPLYMDPEDVDMIIAKQQAENAFGLIARLRELRTRRGMRQQDVAVRMGRDASVVSNLERLGSDPRWSSIQRYACAVGVVISYDLVETLPEELRRTASELDRSAEVEVDALSMARAMAAQ